MALGNHTRERLLDSLDFFRHDLGVGGSGDRRIYEDVPLPPAPSISSAHLKVPANSHVLELSAALARRELSSEELTADLLAAADKLDPRLHAYASRFDRHALDSARRADQERRTRGVGGVLHGIPVAIKDIMATSEASTIANSRAVAVHLSPSRGDATAVQRLRSAGMILMGKTSTMEIACGMPELDGQDQVPRNPWNTDYWTGGSSSGSAAGVAAGLFPASLGSDTAGSIRIPSALCGVTGFKPTNDPRVLGGCLSLSPVMDTVGPIARSAIDCQVLLEALVSPRSPGSASGQHDIGGTRVAVERARFQNQEVDSAVMVGFDAALQTLVDQGVHIDEITLPHYESLQIAARVVWTTDAFARYRRYLPQFGEPTRDLLAVGELNSSADYELALRSRRWAARALTRLLSPYVALLSPTRTCLAPKVSEATVDWQLSSHNHTSVWNLLGFPAVSVPMGLSATGLPMGLQIVGIPGSDSRTLAVAAHFQSVTGWHLQRPPVAGGLSD